ncbi:hypothetical protein GJAV_G00070490 [Gymnothorax javanicus]|nr:hypothetical protein GJAV_G00070490 [Gymnothorax javanicus]
MNPLCARCGKIVYPTEKVNCLDKNWHKGCFHCEVCKMTLNMKNYKGYEKKPYCNMHYPKQSFTIVADTPENLRLKQQSELQSQVKYKKDFEESKGRGFSIVSDTPEMQRLRKTQEQISIVCWARPAPSCTVIHSSLAFIVPFIFTPSVFPAYGLLRPDHPHYVM